MQLDIQVTALSGDAEKRTLGRLLVRPNKGVIKIKKCDLLAVLNSRKTFAFRIEQRRNDHFVTIRIYNIIGQNLNSF